MSALVIVTLLAIMVAAVMTGIMWRLVLQERRRSAARVAALEADICRVDDADIEVLHDPRPPVRPDTDLFPEQSLRRQMPIAPLVSVGAAVLFVFLVAISRHRAPTISNTAAAPARTAAQQTLELLALVHERDDDR